MRKGGITLFACLLLAFCLLGGCSSSKKLLEDVSDNPVLGDLLVAKAVKEMNDYSFFTAKTRLTVKAGSDDVSLSGTLKYKKGVGLQLTLSALGLFEVAAIEFLPNEIMIVSRMDKCYAKCSYQDFVLFKDAGINYDMLQSIFLNELFLYDGGEVKSNYKDYRLTMQEGGTLAQLPRQGQTMLSFSIDTQTQLKQTVVDYNSQYQLLCDYDDFTRLSEKMFPQKLKMSFLGAKKQVKLSWQYGNMKTDNFVWKKLTVSSSYKEVRADKILKF